jgi:hypothetical protein
VLVYFVVELEVVVVLDKNNMEVSAQEPQVVEELYLQAVEAVEVELVGFLVAEPA